MSKFAGLALATEAPARMNIMHPITGQPLRDRSSGESAWIDLLPTTSQAGREHDRGVMDRQLKRRGLRPTADEIDADAVEKLAKLTKAWSLVTLDGDPIAVECDPSNARDLLGMPELSWLRDQIADFVANVANFRVKPPTS